MAAPTDAPPYGADPKDQQQGQQQYIQAPPMNAQPSNPGDVGQQYQQQLYAQCAQGNHQEKTEYGICGIITAVMCFPCGLVALCIDREVKCSRCGVAL